MGIALLGATAATLLWQIILKPNTNEDTPVLLIFGGRLRGEDNRYVDSVLSYDPALNRAVPWPGGPLLAPRAETVAGVYNGTILVAGGRSVQGTQRSSMFYRPEYGRFVYGPEMNLLRRLAAGAVLGRSASGRRHREGHRCSSG